LWPWIGGGCAAVCVLALLHPNLLLTSSVPSGYDLSGHIYPMWVAVNELVPRGRIHGWDYGWFGGFPVYYFYFPLPALLAALLTPVLGFLPAAKIVSAAGMVMLPVMVAWCVVRAGVGGVIGASAVLVGSSFLLMQSYSQLGGNIASGLAGEFSYALGFAMSLAYFAALPLQHENGRRRIVLSAVLLAATAASHVVCAMAAVLGAVPLLRQPRSRQVVLRSWLVAFGLTAAWALPFLIRIEGVETVRVVNRSWGRIFRYELVPLLPLAAIGIVWAARRARRLLLLLAPAAGALLMYLLPSGLSVHPGRMLPYFFLAIHIFSGVAGGIALRWLIDKPTVRSFGAALLVAVLVIWPHTTRSLSVLWGWAAWNYSGFSAKSSWPELERLLAELQKLPPGRVYWHDNADAFALRGSRHLFAVLPYWLPQHGALRGLWSESSLLSESLNAVDDQIAAAYTEPDRVLAATRYANALRYLSELATRYFITADAHSADIVSRTGVATLLATAGELNVFGLTAAPIVTAAGHPGAVSALDIDNVHIRFQTAAPGVPHLIRVGYFANWKASGAAGPVRVPPNFMSVVPATSVVSLRFRPTWVEWVGTSLTLASLAWLVYLAIGAVARQWRRSGRRSV
jgi:hypothetical protein